MATSDYTSERYIVAFWNKVDKNGSIPIHCPELGQCWEWKSPSVDRKGYGITHFGDRNSKQGHAHRYAWIITNGDIPSSKIFVLHKCDNPKCCNPKHLFLGTNQDNVDDMVHKGRNVKGVETAHAKMTNELVVYIRERYAQGDISMKKLGLEVGLAASNICQIVNHKSWKHVNE